MNWVRPPIPLPFKYRVLQCVWSITIVSAQSALRSSPQSQTACSQLSATMQVLKEFFNADGNGLTDKKLESEEYKVIVIPREANACYC